MYFKLERRIMSKPKIICVANFKGGIGKTTTADAVASILSHMGYKTLLIDADPQCNSTDTYRALTKDTATLYDVILDYEDPLPINEAIQKTPSGDIIASDPELRESDTKFQHDGNEYFRLSDALDKLSGYSYVVIDTAPANNILLKNCLVAANYVLIPITADRYSIQGLSELNMTIIGQKKRNNPNLKIAGILLIKYKPYQLLAKEVHSALENISEQMHTKVFNSTIRENIAVQKAQAARTMLIDYDDGCNAAKDYRSFVNELLEDFK